MREEMQMPIQDERGDTGLRKYHSRNRAKSWDKNYFFW